MGAKRTKNGKREPRAGDARLRTAREAPGMFAWECDIAARTVQWSDHAAAVIGCRPEELPRDMRECHFFVAADDVARLNLEYDEAVGRRQDAYASEFRGRGEPGTAKYYLAHARLLYDRGGRPARVIGVTQDVSERKRAEIELRRIREELALQLAASQRLHAVSAQLLAGGNAQEAFDQVLEIAAAVVKADCASMQVLEPAADAGHPARLRLIAHRGFHPESAAFWHWVDAASTSACAIVLASRRRVVIEDTKQCVNLHKGDVEAYRRSGIRAVQSTPFVSRSGRLLGTISTHWRRPHRPSERELELFDAVARQAGDLVECAQTHAAVRESEERLRAFIRATSEVVFRMSPDWSEMRFLQGREFIADTRVPNRSWLDKYIPHEDHRSIKAAIRHAIETKITLELEHRVIRADGVLAWAHTRAIPILDAQGGIVEWFGAASDVTNRKDAQERSARASRLSPREREVLALVAEGLRTKEIAAKLDIADATVEVHRRSVMRKLALRSIAALTRFAVDAGLTQAPKDETVRLKAEHTQAEAAYRSTDGPYIALSVAAAIVFHRAQGSTKAIVSREDYDDALSMAAAALARLVPIYTVRNARGGHVALDIDPARQRFVRGATRLLAEDGTSIEGLSIRRADLEDALATLKRMPPPLRLALAASREARQDAEAMRTEPES